MVRRPIIFILVAVSLLIVFGWIIFSIPWGSSNSTSNEQAAVEQKKLTDYADTDTKVRLIQNGEINSDEEHREIWITVGRSEVIAEVKQGYEGTTIKSERFANNVNAYHNFLAALDGQGFTRTREYKGEQTESGACPKGKRYIFDTYSPSETIQHSWATSCSKDTGTFTGKTDTVRQLFQGQVPGYDKFAQGVEL